LYFLNLYVTCSDNDNNISSNFSISVTFSGNVIELPIPFGFSGKYFTSLSSIPFAYSHICKPCFPNFLIITSLLVFAKSPIVLICIFCNLGTVLLPSINNSDTDNGHIFCFISFIYKVCILSGFAKSEAIFASNLLFATPIFTVKPNSFFTLTCISCATSIKDLFIK